MTQFTKEENKRILESLTEEEKTGLLEKTHKVKQFLFPLKPLPKDITTEELKRIFYIYCFSGRADVEVVKATGTTLHMPKPVKPIKTKTWQEVLRMYPGLEDLNSEHLLLKAPLVLPSKQDLVSVMLQAIIESEKGVSYNIPTKDDTWVLGLCVDDGVMCALSCTRMFGGWDFDCEPVGSFDKWDTGFLFFILAKKKHWM